MPNDLCDILLAGNSTIEDLMALAKKLPTDRLKVTRIAKGPSRVLSERPLRFPRCCRPPGRHGRQASNQPTLFGWLVRVR